MGAWCGRYGRGWGSPCNLDVVLCILFALIATLTVSAQIKRLQLLSRRQVDNSGSKKASLLTSISGYIYSITAVLPFIWLIISLATQKHAVAGFQIFTEVIFLASWIPVAVRMWLIFLQICFIALKNFSFEVLCFLTIILLKIKMSWINDSSSL